jgi:hypothetical protein
MCMWVNNHLSLSCYYSSLASKKLGVDLTLHCTRFRLIRGSDSTPVLCYSSCRREISTWTKTMRPSCNGMDSDWQCHPSGCCVLVKEGAYKSEAVYNKCTRASYAPRDPEYPALMPQFPRVFSGRWNAGTNVWIWAASVLVWLDWSHSELALSGSVSLSKRYNCRFWLSQNFLIY